MFFPWAAADIQLYPHAASTKMTLTGNTNNLCILGVIGHEQMWILIIFNFNFECF